jgi:hypothetical protein
VVPANSTLSNCKNALMLAKLFRNANSVATAEAIFLKQQPVRARILSCYYGLIIYGCKGNNYTRTYHD